MLVFKNHEKILLTCQRFWDWTCDVKSCCCSCLPSLRSQDLTVLSRPPVHNLVPSLEMSMQLAPSVWPWNCLKILNKDQHILSKNTNIFFQSLSCNLDSNSNPQWIQTLGQSCEFFDKLMMQSGQTTNVISKKKALRIRYSENLCCWLCDTHYSK